jgi:hypothetical protein
LFEAGFDVFDNFLGENVGIRKIVGAFKRFVSARRVEIRKDPLFVPLQGRT